MTIPETANTLVKRSLSPELELKSAKSVDKGIEVSRAILADTDRSKKSNKRPRTERKENVFKSTVDETTENTVKKQKTESHATGRWTELEHSCFLVGLEKYGKDWRNIANHIKTRSYVQTRTHAQKYFKKVAKERYNTGKEIPRELISTANDGKEWKYGQNEKFTIGNLRVQNSPTGKDFGLAQLSSLAGVVAEKKFQQNLLAAHNMATLAPTLAGISNSYFNQLHFLAAASNAQQLMAASQGIKQPASQPIPNVASMIQQPQLLGQYYPFLLQQTFVDQ